MGVGEYVLNSKENINTINNKKIPKEIDNYKNVDEKLYVLSLIKYLKLKNIGAGLFNVIEKNTNLKKYFYVNKI